MFLPNSFIDALADYESAYYVIFGVPFDNTSSYRAGSRWAPDAMRQASANFESYNPTFNIDLVDLPIHDAGNLERTARSHPSGKGRVRRSRRRRRRAPANDRTRAERVE